MEVLLAAVLVFWCGPRRARKLTALAGGAALLAAALLFFWMAPRHIAERLATMGDGTHPPEVELGNRLVAARDSLGILRDHPWLGAGLGSFETAFPRYQSFPSDFLWDHAHNDYAEALAETGLAGGALILCALGLFFRLAFREVVSGQWLLASGSGLGIGDWGLGNSESLSRVPSSESRAPNPGSAALASRPVNRLRSTAYSPPPPHTWHLRPDTFLRLAAAVGCCGVLVHSFLDFNLHIPANAAWFAVCAALATSSRQKAVGRNIT